MFQKGDLIWLPQETVLLLPRPNSPQAIRIVNKPEVGLLIGESEEDKDFYHIVCDGREWVTNKKYVKLLRRENASKVS